MFIFILFVLIIGAAIYMFYNLSSKIAAQHKQMMVLANQNAKLKNKMAKSSDECTNVIVIKYITPSCERAETTEKCRIHISPLVISNIVSYIECKTELELIDSAEVLGLTWYEVSVPQSERINNKGWVKASHINIISN